MGIVKKEENPNKKIKKILKKSLEIVSLNKQEISSINLETECFIKKINPFLKKIDPRIYVFIGGSLAKGTVIRKKLKYDVDLFVIFPRQYALSSDKISSLLEKALKNCKTEYKKLNGSRDYFQVKKDKLIFELVPILEINRASEASNITDVSPLHVKYLLKKIKQKKNLAQEIMLAKYFCYVNDLYGAESHIQGFSGYSLEIMVSYFGSFMNMIKFFSKRKDIFLNKKNKKQKIFLDPEKYYKSNKEILANINKSKIDSPIILIDPVDKSRNVSAALSYDKFVSFLKIINNFLNKPSEEFFSLKDFNLNEILQKAKKNNCLLFELKILTTKGKIDVAGAKINKISDFLIRELNKFNFKILFRKIIFLEDKLEGKLYLVIKNPEKEMIAQGPKIKYGEAFVKDFKKSYNKKGDKIFVKNGRYFAKTKNLFSNFEQFFNFFKLKNKETLKLMSIKDFYFKQIV